MTTAARPTFDPAKGGTSRGEKSLSSLSKQYSSRDLPSHTKLKYRQSGQGTTDDLKTKDFRRELEEREHLAALEKDGKRPPPPSAQLEGISALPSTSSSSSASASAAKKPRIEYQNLSQLDADEKLDSDSEDDDGGGNDYDDSDDDDDDSEDDTAALLAELNRIKQERAAEEAKKDEERKLQENQIRMENILAGNPLLNPGSKGASAGPSSFKVKRRWDDDVVFKNCAKGEGQNKRGFINDTLRSDFHRKFMEKYIK